MRRGWRRLMPDALATRLVLLLAIAVLAANLIALGIVGLEQDRSQRRADERREIERIVSLVPALEALAPMGRQAIARNASTRFARLRIAGAPSVVQTADDDRSRYVAEALSEVLGEREIAAAFVDRGHIGEDGDRRPGGRQRDVIALSIRLAAPPDGSQWLNVVTTGASPRGREQEDRAFRILLAVSLLFVLGVAALSARRLTRPLNELAGAARAAGRGDRSARVSETGAREMREAARAFNQMQTEIERFDAERLRTLAAVGHDLRTPMTSLRIRAEMVEDDSQREAMIRTLDEMGVMADGLVSYALEGREAEPPVQIDLTDLVAGICADRDVAFVPEGTSMIEGRPVALTRAIGNLVDNAVRYGRDVEVATHSGDPATVIVEDRGPGISADFLDTAFEPFTRGERSRNVQTGGAGLGLSIARKIIEAHGGQITLENRKGGGLHARVELPTC